MVSTAEGVNSVRDSFESLREQGNAFDNYDIQKGSEMCSEDDNPLQQKLSLRLLKSFKFDKTENTTDTVWQNLFATPPRGPPADIISASRPSSKKLEGLAGLLKC